MKKQLMIMYQNMQTGNRIKKTIEVGITQMDKSQINKA